MSAAAKLVPAWFDLVNETPNERTSLVNHGEEDGDIEEPLTRTASGTAILGRENASLSRTSSNDPDTNQLRRTKSKTGFGHKKEDTFSYAYEQATPLPKV